MVLSAWGVTPQPQVVLKPLQYCQFRVHGEGECTIFAHGVIEGMTFCARHGAMVEEAIVREKGVFGDSHDNKGVG